MRTRTFTQVARQSFLVGCLGVGIALGASGGASAMTEKDVKVKPPVRSWSMCTFYTNMHMELIFESNTNPDQGVDYDAAIDGAAESMDRWCTQYSIDVS